MWFWCRHWGSGWRDVASFACGVGQGRSFGPEEMAGGGAEADADVIAGFSAAHAIAAHDKQCVAGGFDVQDRLGAKAFGQADGSGQFDIGLLGKTQMLR